MIASISGILQVVGEKTIVINVGGIGFELQVSSGVTNTLPEIGQEVALPVKLIVREDSMTLYGFASEEEKLIFALVMGVSGIGPRIAMAVISTLSPEMLANAVQRDEPEVISRVPGIGKKTAQKVVLDLKGKLLPADLTPGLGAVSSFDADVVDALTALGYSIVEAQAALQSIPHDAPEDIEERVRLALNYFYG